MTYLTYTTRISFFHKIARFEGLKDEACLVTHQHKDAMVRVSVQTKKGVPLDFKTIKETVGFLIPDGLNLNTAMETEDASMENFVEWLRKRVRDALRLYGLGKRNVLVYVQETPKYGCGQA